MHIAILTFDGFNELDSLIALGILHRIKKPDWRVTLCCPTPEVTSMNGVTLHAQSALEEARSAEAVIVGSGTKTRDVVADPALMAPGTRSRSPTHRRPVFRHADPGQARSAGERAGVHGPDHQAVGAGGRCRSAEPAVLRARQRCDGWRLPGLALPGRVGHRAHGRARCSARSAPLRRPGGRKGARTWPTRSGTSNLICRKQELFDEMCSGGIPLLRRDRARCAAPRGRRRVRLRDRSRGGRPSRPCCRRRRDCRCTCWRTRRSFPAMRSPTAPT